MKFDIPDIKKLVLDTHKELIKKQEDIKHLKLNPLNDYIVFKKEEEIKDIQNVLSDYSLEIYYKGYYQQASRSEVIKVTNNLNLENELNDIEKKLNREKKLIDLIG